MPAKINPQQHTYLSRNAHRLIIIGLIVLGLALRIWFLSVNAIDPRFSTADDGDYYQRAMRLAITGAYIDDFWLIRPPLHVFFFAFLLRISILLGDLTMGLGLIRAVQIGLFLLTIPLGYDLARRLFNPRAGLIFAALLTVWFPLVELPIHTFSEPLFFVLFALHLWLLVCWRDARLRTLNTAKRTLFSASLLAAAGVTLGLAALTRAPALYAAVFVLFWLLLVSLEDGRQHRGVDTQQHNMGQRLGSLINQLWPDIRASWRMIIGRCLIFLGAMVLTIAPWTMRNYLVYERFIPVDTLGAANLWLDMQPDRREKIELLKTIPQADRQAFAVGELKQILGDNPLRLWHDAWPNFQHIWKAQFVEDFLLKPNFYTRPLRETWLLGMAGDLLWFSFTLVGLVALAAPAREGSFRWLLLGWLGYTILTVLLLHVEPRYLMPIWFILMLYAAWAFSRPSALIADLRRHRFNAALALLLMISFLTIFFSYRNYPTALARGMQREWYHLAGSRAYAAGDYAAAIAAYQHMVLLDPRSVDGRVDLARLLLARADYEAASQALGNTAANRAQVVRAAIARAQGDTTRATQLFKDAAQWEGEDIQALTLNWLTPPPTTHLTLGDGLDYGYIRGFSAGEQIAQPDAPPRSYRWLQGHGRIVLPLPHALSPESHVMLEMAGGQPEATSLQVQFDQCQGRMCRVTLPVSAGQWRSYVLPIPPALAGQTTLSLTLSAPTFIPAHINPDSNDMRPLSVMISTVGVEP